MLKKLNYVILGSVIATMCACVSTTKMSEPLPSNTRTAVVTAFSSQANFRRMAHVAVDNARFKHSLPGLNVNATVKRAAGRHLARNAHLQVVDVPQLGTKHVSQKPVYANRTEISPEYKRFISKSIEGKNIDKVVLVAPSQSGFQMSTTNHMLMPGYGMFDKTSYAFRHVMAYGTFEIFVVDPRNWNILAKTAGGNYEKLPAGAWKPKFALISKENVQLTAGKIKHGYQHSIPKALQKIGL